jgi:hypothetical protein
MVQNDEKRRHRRYVVEGIHGNVLNTTDLEILNISADGAAIETAKRLELNREYTFKIKHGDTLLSVKGLVVWAILVSKEKRGSLTAVPVYRVGVKFIDTANGKANLLLDFIEEHKIRTMENRPGGVRFRISNTDRIKLDYPYSYKVKKMSLSGMLIETEYPLDLNSRYLIELFLNNRTLHIMGRTANCEKGVSDTALVYDIGIEFIDMKGQDREVLREFLGTAGE